MCDSRSGLIAVYLDRREELIRFFTLRLRSPAAAEDLVQDIYLRLQGLELPEAPRNPSAYLYRLGSNLMLDRIRGERRTAARDEAWRDSQRSTLGPEEVAEDPPADVALAARQRLAALVAALTALPPLTQRVFRLHKFEGLTHAQTAEALGISKSSVEKHIMAALRRLAERPL
jgi:RNA polymerase sigma factor (sigma-70 family)